MVGNLTSPFLICESCLPIFPPSSDQTTKDQHNQNVAENQLSTQIIALLEHYKQKDPLGMPGNLVADPFPVPDSEQSLPMGLTLTTINALAYGLSKFRIKNIALDLYQMLVRMFALNLILIHKFSEILLQFFFIR